MVVARLPTGQSCFSRATKRTRVITCSCTNSEKARAQPASRRELMAAGLTLLSLIPSYQAAASCTEQATEEEADACRRNVLVADKDKKQDYTVVSEKKFTAVSGVPVANLDQEYVKATLALSDEITRYATLDPENYKERVPLLKTLKQDGQAWVSKYARGGSARTESARKMYIAVDAVLGHIAANGYAPMPNRKLQVVRETLDKSLAYLQEGK